MKNFGLYVLFLTATAGVLSACSTSCDCPRCPTTVVTPASPPAVVAPSY